MTGAKEGWKQKNGWPMLVHCVNASNNRVMQNANNKLDMDGARTLLTTTWNDTCQKLLAWESIVIEVN